MVSYPGHKVAKRFPCLKFWEVLLVKSQWANLDELNSVTLYARQHPWFLERWKVKRAGGNPQPLCGPQLARGERKLSGIIANGCFLQEKERNSTRPMHQGIKWTKMALSTFQHSKNQGWCFEVKIADCARIAPQAEGRPCLQLISGANLGFFFPFALSGEKTLTESDVCSVKFWWSSKVILTFLQLFLGTAAPLLPTQWIECNLTFLQRNVWVHDTPRLPLQPLF